MRAKLGVLTALVALAGASLVGGVGVVEAAKAADKQGCAPVTDQIQVATINVRANPIMPRDKVVADVDRATKMDVDVLMWQEISPDYYKNAIRAEKIGDPRRGEWRTFHLDLAVPITVRLGGDSPWEFVSEGHQLMHGFRAHVSPNRYISWVVLKNKQSGRKTMFMNTHMVSGAWNSKPNLDDAWRRQMWLKHRAEQTKAIAGFNDRGLSVVYGGDFNRHDVQPFGPRDKQVVDTGIDHLGVVLTEGDKLAKVETTKTVKGFNSDHDGKLMKVQVGGCGKGAAPTGKPTTQAPTGKPTSKPPTGKPTSKAPTGKPTTKAPTGKPTTGAPASPRGTQPPATQAPATQAPATQAPATQGPAQPAGPAQPGAEEAGVPAPPVTPGEGAEPEQGPVGDGGSGDLDAKDPEHTGGLASTGH